MKTILTLAFAIAAMVFTGSAQAQSGTQLGIGGLGGGAVSGAPSIGSFGGGAVGGVPSFGSLRRWCR